MIRLDGANVAQWDRADFGRYVGYLPQEIELFSDTVAANIARLRSGADEDIVRAALGADVHEMILALPQGYETQIGEGGVNLSGGHRQRIALARALYGDPSLVVLDEPSSNLDMEGDVALARCLGKLKEEGRTVVIISHRHVNLGTVDKILVLHGGAVAMFGPSCEVMAKLGVKPVAIPSIAGSPPAAAARAPRQEILDGAPEAATRPRALCRKIAALLPANPVELPMSELILPNPMQQAPLPNESARGAIIAGLAVLVVFFFGLGGWAAFAPLNGAVVAPAVVKVEGNRKTIQHLDGGIVKELLVKEGDRVEPGQTVVALEDTQARAAVDVLSQQYDVLRAQEARLLAERDGAGTITFPDEPAARRGDPAVAKILDTETKQFDIRRTGLAGQISVWQKKLKQLEEQIRGGEAQQLAVKKLLQIIAAELKDQNYLLEKGLTQRPRVLELERTASGLRGQQGDIAGAIARAYQAIGEIELQMIQARNDRMTDVAKDLREAQAKVVDVAPRLQAARDVLDRTRIRTPYGGYVVDLSVFSVGGVIQRGDRVMDIVPSQNNLIAEANINVDDIHEVHPGMRAELHFTAYKQRVIPIIHGDVIDVSADRLTDKRTGTPYYTALVKVDEKELAASKEVVLTPGMAATAMIPTKERTALDYLLGPVVASFDRSFRQK